MNTASRMESTCRPGCVHVSEEFARLLPSEEWESKSSIEVKGKGVMQTCLWVPKPHDEESDNDGYENERSLKHNQSGSSYVSTRSRVTVSEQSARSMMYVCMMMHVMVIEALVASLQTTSRKFSASFAGREGREGCSESENPLMAILTNIRHDGGSSGPSGGDENTSTTSGLRKQRQPKAKKVLDETHPIIPAGNRLLTDLISSVSRTPSHAQMGPIPERERDRMSKEEKGWSANTMSSNTR